MKKLFLFSLMCVLAGCGSVRMVEPGPLKLGERLSVSIPAAWNHVDFPAVAPSQAQLWTAEGLGVDELLIFYGLRDGQRLSNTRPAEGKKPLTFKSSMGHEEIAALIQGSMTLDGSTFKTLKFEPARLDGRPGFRLEFEKIRQTDSVQLRGLAFATVDNGQLFALIYQAPRLSFYDRRKSQIESMAKSLTIR